MSTIAEHWANHAKMVTESLQVDPASMEMQAVKATFYGGACAFAMALVEGSRDARTPEQSAAAVEALLEECRQWAAS